MQHLRLKMIRQITHYSREGVVCFVNKYPKDSDFPIESIIQAFNYWSQERL